MKGLKSKVLCFVMALVLIASSLPAFLLAAVPADSILVTLSVEEVVDAGESFIELTVNTEFGANTEGGLSDFDFTVEFDGELLTLVGTAGGDFVTTEANVDLVFIPAPVFTPNSIRLTGAIEDLNRPAWVGDVAVIRFSYDADEIEVGDPLEFTLTVNRALCWDSYPDYDFASTAVAEPYTHYYEGPTAYPPTTVGVEVVQTPVFGNRQAISVTVTNTIPDTTLPAGSYVLVVAGVPGVGGPVFSEQVRIDVPLATGASTTVNMGLSLRVGEITAGVFADRLDETVEVPHTAWQAGGHLGLGFATVGTN